MQNYRFIELSVLAASLLAFVACSDKGGQVVPMTGVTSGTGAGTGAGTGVAATPAAGSPSAGATGFAPRAGAAAPPSGGAGAAGKPSPTDDDAGTTTADAGAMPAPDAGATPGPIVLPDPDKMGPFMVEITKNVGKGFENTVNANDRPGATYCTSFALGFGQDEEESRKFAMIPPDLDMALFSVYRPATFEEGKKYPLLTWGNGTCALPEGYGTLLRHIASHGFIIVAAHTRFTAGSGKSAPMIKAVDWALQANGDATSPLYQKIDAEKIGAMGHSQGGGATWSAAADSRIKTNIIFNAGGSGTRSSSSFFVSGDRDIVSESSQRSMMNAQSKAAMIFYHMIPGTGSADGHLTLITEPARVVGPATAWFRYQLNGDAAAKDWFVGTSCKLCGRDAEFEFAAKGLQ